MSKIEQRIETLENHRSKELKPILRERERLNLKNLDSEAPTGYTIKKKIQKINHIKTMHQAKKYIYIKKSQQKTWRKFFFQTKIEKRGVDLGERRKTRERGERLLLK